MSDYVDIATKSWDEVPEPKTLPVGSYRLRNRGASRKKGDEYETVMFVYTPMEPMADVDAEELERLGAEYDLGTNRIFTKFFINEKSDWNKVKKHVAKHGIEPVGDIDQTLKALKGKDVIAYLTVRTFQDNAGDQQETNEAQNFAPVE